MCSWNWIGQAWFPRSAFWIALALTSACAAEGTAPSGWPPRLLDRIIFTRSDPACLECTPEIWTAAVDGSDLDFIVRGLGWPQRPQVSPDGRSVVFEDGGVLYLVRSDGTSLHPIATGLTYHEWASWSADGEWIRFGGWDEESESSQAYAVHPDGSGLHLESDPAKGNAITPSWAPDGRRLAFIRQVEQPGYWRQMVVVRDLITGAENVVTDSSKADFWGWWPEWSPDGAHLTLLDGNESSSGWVIKRIDLGSGEMTVLGDARGNRSAPWSPDGLLLIYGTGELWTMSPDGSASHLLLGDDMYNYNAAWTPARKAP